MGDQVPASVAVEVSHTTHPREGTPAPAGQHPCARQTAAGAAGEAPQPRRGVHHQHVHEAVTVHVAHAGQTAHSGEVTTDHGDAGDAQVLGQCVSHQLELGVDAEHFGHGVTIHVGRDGQFPQAIPAGAHQLLARELAAAEPAPQVETSVDVAGQQLTLAVAVQVGHLRDPGVLAGEAGPRPRPTRLARRPGGEPAQRSVRLHRDQVGALVAGLVAHHRACGSRRLRRGDCRGRSCRGGGIWGGGQRPREAATLPGHATGGEVLVTGGARGVDRLCGGIASARVGVHPGRHRRGHRVGAGRGRVVDASIGEARHRQTGARARLLAAGRPSQPRGGAAQRLVACRNRPGQREGRVGGRLLVDVTAGEIGHPAAGDAALHHVGGAEDSALTTLCNPRLVDRRLPVAHGAGHARAQGGHVGGDVGAGAGGRHHVSVTGDPVDVLPRQGQLGRRVAVVARELPGQHLGHRAHRSVRLCGRG